MVATNHSAATGQRCRALHIAIRTVAGSRPGVLTGGRRLDMRGQSTRSDSSDDDIGVDESHSAANPSRRAALVLERAPIRGRHVSNGSIVERRARSPARAIRHVPAYMPSSRKVPIDAPLPGGSGIRRPAGMIRDRSAWPISTLSYSGRKRGGAGTSGSGRGASGRSNSSRPRVVAERGELRVGGARPPAASRVRPDQARMSAPSRGRRRAR